jgi:L-alanine-DL-glutamate epimerase-like enolase superfamily enzyme
MGNQGLEAWKLKYHPAGAPPCSKAAALGQKYREILFGFVKDRLRFYVTGWRVPETVALVPAAFDQVTHQGRTAFRFRGGSLRDNRFFRGARGKRGGSKSLK